LAPLGERIEDAYFAKTAHPVSVMVWGGIGPLGYRTELLKCPKSVTGDTYIEMLTSHGIIAKLEDQFGHQGYWFQQDNAPAHGALKRELAQFVNLLDWPAKSADLSPIEQVWALIKNRIRGKEFKNESELFNAICTEWYAIPNDTLENFQSSFKSRCSVCAKYGGSSLNGRWAEVHQLHHQPLG
jgi:hypothetical protein